MRFPTRLFVGASISHTDFFIRSIKIGGISMLNDDISWIDVDERGRVFVDTL